VAILWGCAGLPWASDPSRIPQNHAPVLGIRHDVPTSDSFERNQLPAEVGREVLYVHPGSTAAQLGLRPGDVITAINGIPVTDGTSIRHELGHSALGETVGLTIVRDGSELQVAGQLTNGNGFNPGPGSTPEELRGEEEQRRVERQRQEGEQEQLADALAELAALRREVADLHTGEAPADIRADSTAQAPAWRLLWHSDGLVLKPAN
jgi:membrane-associated protease RseP (regulator of RpoE activity)